MATLTGIQYILNELVPENATLSTSRVQDGQTLNSWPHAGPQAIPTVQRSPSRRTWQRFLAQEGRCVRILRSQCMRTDSKILKYLFGGTDGAIHMSKHQSWAPLVQNLSALVASSKCRPPSSAHQDGPIQTHLCKRSRLANEHILVNANAKLATLSYELIDKCNFVLVS